MLARHGHQEMPQEASAPKRFMFWTLWITERAVRRFTLPGASPSRVAISRFLLMTRVAAPLAGHHLRLALHQCCWQPEPMELTV